MNSRDYWRKREEEARKNYIREEKKFRKEINSIYESMMDEIQSEIDSFYARYAEKEGISIAAAKRKVSKIDMEEYERKAKKYVEDRDFSDIANEEMRLYNLTMKVNRLEMMKARINLALTAGHDELDEYMSELLNDRAYQEFIRLGGILGETVVNPEKKAAAIVNASFRNANFSERIWGNKAALQSKLEQMLTSGLIQGRNPRDYVRDLRKIFGIGNYEAERLMRTEMARVQTEAQKQSFERNGYDEYVFLALGSACEICKDINEKHFKVKDMTPGENAPPMHPNCRCSTAAWVDEKEFDKWLTTKGQKQGLAANGDGAFIKPHADPKLVTTIDPNDEEAVSQLIAEFENTAAELDYETARVITKDGKVYDCFGVANAVYPDYDLGEELYGAIVTHAHPMSETEFSFSSVDMALFSDYNLKVLRGCDEMYLYELNHTGAVDPYPKGLIPGIYAHGISIRYANEEKVGYRRWKR